MVKYVGSTESDNNHEHEYAIDLSGIGATLPGDNNHVHEIFMWEVLPADDGHSHSIDKKRAKETPDAKG